MFRYCEAGTVRLVLFVPSEIHEKIQDFREIKWKNSQKQCKDSQK
jgi:hypothetical protein